MYIAQADGYTWSDLKQTFCDWLFHTSSKNIAFSEGSDEWERCIIVIWYLEAEAMAWYVTTEME